MTNTIQHRRVRVGTIVWGALLVAVAIFAILVLHFGPLGPAAILWTIIGFGSILVVGAAAAGIARTARKDRPTIEPEAIPVTTPLATVGDDDVRNGKANGDGAEPPPAPID